MNFFTFDLKKVFILILMVAIPLISVNLQKDQNQTPWIIKPFAFVGDIVQQAYSGFSAGVRGTTSLYLDLIDIRKENRLLTKENAEFRAKLGALTELHLENERLNKLLVFKQKTNMELLAAKVIGNDLLPDHSTITINRGTHHGIKKNMAAITVGGVVGYVLQPELYTSRLLLLTDRYAAIDAIVQRSRARGIIEGKTKDSCQLRYLQRGDDVKVGDLIVTSGLDNIFPKGFPIGTVIAVDKSEYGMSQDVDVSPSINPFTLEEIFVVLNANNEDFTPPPETTAPETSAVTDPGAAANSTPPKE